MKEREAKSQLLKTFGISVLRQTGSDYYHGEAFGESEIELLPPSHHELPHQLDRIRQENNIC